AGAAVRSSLFFTNGSTDTLTVIDRHFVSFSYTTTYSCNDISDTLEPLIRDIHNFSDESTFYTYTASPTGLAIADSNGFIVLNQSQSNTYTISLQTEYCTDDNTFELPVYPNLNPDAGNDFVFTEQLFCGQDSVTITIDSAFFERGSSASNAIYITNDLSNLEQTNLPSQSITLAEGNYFLSIRNQFGPTCRDTFKVEVLDFCNIQEDENKPILAPNQTGDYQEFAISDTGNVTIFNKEGRLMNRFEAPVIWDGANSNGQSLPTGLYFIILDDKKKYEITIVR
ncbi:MAG: hypothetical protein AB8B61_02525, partial [Cyclobacteriaceae bacterium]